MSSGTSYPPLPSYGSQGYDDPAQHEISRSYQPAALYSGNDTDTSQSPPPSVQQGQLPQLGQLPQRTQTSPTSEAKPRLRKACDSCSIRKVKVRHTRSRGTSKTNAGSATSPGPHVVPAQLSRSPVPLRDRVDDEGLPTNMRKLSRDKSSAITARTHLPHMMRH